MVSNNNELYDAIQALIRQLTSAGEEKWSAAMRDALSISSVPGEVLGETRLQLQQLRASPIVAQLHLEQQIDEGIRYLNDILGSWP
jgi:hypothetical protein